MTAHFDMDSDHVAPMDVWLEVGRRSGIGTARRAATRYAMKHGQAVILLPGGGEVHLIRCNDSPRKYMERRYSHRQATALRAMENAKIDPMALCLD